MQTIQNYTILNKIAETRGSLVYRARKSDGKDTFIIKALKANRPTASDIARFKHEFEIIQTIELDGIIKTFEIILERGICTCP